MKILVIEDTEKHIKAAEEQLVEHEVVILESFEDFFNFDVDHIPGGEVRFDLSEFDAVLTDVNIPSPLDNPRSVVESPTGLLIAFKSLEAQVPYIGVITDADHHMDALTKGFDMWIHSVENINTGTSVIHMMNYDSCTYPNQSLSLIPIKGWEEKEDTLRKFGEIREANGDIFLLPKDPFSKSYSSENRCKNWARLLRIITEEFLPSDLIKNREKFKELLLSGYWD